MDDICYICRNPENLLAPCTRCLARIHQNCLTEQLSHGQITCGMCKNNLALTKKFNRNKCFEILFAQFYLIFIFCISTVINIFMSIGMNNDYADKKVEGMCALMILVNFVASILIVLYIGENLKNYYNLSMLPCILFIINVFLRAGGYLVVWYGWYGWYRWELPDNDFFTCQTYLAGIVMTLILLFFFIICSFIVELIEIWYKNLISFSTENTKFNRTKCFNRVFTQFYAVVIFCISMAINIFISVRKNNDYTNVIHILSIAATVLLNIATLIAIILYIRENLTNYYNLSILPGILFIFNMLSHVLGEIIIWYGWGLNEFFTCRTYATGFFAIMLLLIFIILCSIVLETSIYWYKNLINSSLETICISENK